MENIVTILAYLLDIFPNLYFHEICVHTYIIYNELSDYQILSRKWLDIECTKLLICIDDPLMPSTPPPSFISIIELLYNICTVFNMLPY